MAKQFYRDVDPTTGKEVIKEVGTGRYIGPTEFGTGAGFQESANPAYKRTDTGGIQKYAASPLTSFEQQLKFKNLVKEAIQRKQNFNKDINSSETYWRGMVQDPMTFTDERLRLLDPNEQQALREKAYSTANAHLYGLAKEREDRGQRTEDVLKGIADVQEAKVKDKEEARTAANQKLDDEYRRLQILKARADLGGSSTMDEVYGSHVDNSTLRVGNRQGGSAAWRNNNPLNIKYSYGNGNVSGLAKSLLAAGIQIQEGSKATDGGSFISFPSYEDGLAAARQLLTSKAYSGLTLEKAMKKWSNNGYGASVWNKDYATNTMDTITGDNLDSLIEAMAKRESWKEGTILDAGTDQIEITDANKASIMKATGLTQADTKNFTTDDWVNYESVLREAQVAEAVDLITMGDQDTKLPALRTQLKFGRQTIDNPSVEQVKAYLVTKYKDLSNAEIESILIQAGATPPTSRYETTWKWIE